MFFVVSFANAATITVSSSTTWSALNPNSTDDIVVRGGATLTIDVTNATCASLQLGRAGGNGAETGTLTFASTGSPSLTVSGAVLIGGTSTGNGITGTVTFTNGSTMTAGSLRLGGSNGGNTGTVTMSAGGTLIIGGNITIGADSGTWTPGTGTVILTGTNTLPATKFTSFNNLYITGGTTTMGTDLNVTGNLNILGGGLTANGSKLAVTGNLVFASGTTMNLGNVNTHTAGALAFASSFQTGGVWGGSNSSAANKSATYFGTTATGRITVSAASCTAGYWSGLTSTDWNTPSNWCSNAVPSSSTNVVIPAGTPFSPSISAYTASVNNLTINASAALTLVSNSNTVLNISGNFVSNGTFSASGSLSKINFVGGNQTVAGVTYSNLTLSPPSPTGSGTKTFSAAVTVTNLLAIETNVVASLGSIQHYAGILTLGGAGPLSNSWGSTSSNPVATNTNNTFFDTSSGRININGSIPYPAIDNNYAWYVNGNSGDMAGTSGEYGNAAHTIPGSVTLSAPIGSAFINVKFASYGLPGGTSPNFTIGSCHAFNSRAVTTGLLGSNVATVPPGGAAFNTTFGDPCQGVVKSYNVVATYAQPFCTTGGVPQIIINGSTPTGGNGTYTYLWEKSTSTDPTTGYTAASGTNNGVSYTVPANTITGTTYYRRTVTSGIYSDATIVIIQVVTGAPTQPAAGSFTSTTSCAGTTTLSVGNSGSLGGLGGYVEFYSDSCGGTVVGTSNTIPASVVVSPTMGNLTYYVRYKNSCDMTAACQSTTVANTTMSISAASSATDLCYSTTAQNALLNYSATVGSPNRYSIVWNAAALAAGLVNQTDATFAFGAGSGTINTIAVPANVPGGTYTGTLTVKNATSGCVSFMNTFTLLIKPSPTVVVSGTTTVCLNSASPNITFTNPQALPITVTYKINSGGNQIINLAANTTATVAAPTSVAGVFVYNLVSAVYQSGPTCSSTLASSATITVNSTPTITLAKTDETCAASNNGTITPSISGGLANIRYIKLTQKYVNVDAYQQVAEIEAFEIFTGTNVARSSVGATATASSVYSAAYPASSAIDGDNSGVNNFWHSATPNTNEYILVDLKAGKNLDYLKIYNRTDCCAQRGQNMLLELLDASNNVVYSKTIDLYQSNTVTNVTLNVLDVSWSDGGTTLNRTGLDAGTYTLSYADGAGCSTSSPASIGTTYPDAAVTSVTGPSSICIGGTATTYTANGVVLGNGTGAWNSTTPSVATVDAFGKVTGVSAGTTTITYTITSGCGGTKSAQIPITVNANAAVSSVTGPSSICIGGTATTYTANGVVLGGGSGAWNSSSPSVATVDTSGNVTGVSAGTTIIKYTITSGCGGTKSAQISITVNATANAGTVTAGISPQCIGGTTTYTVSGQVLGGGTGGWTSDNTSVATVVASTGVVTAVSAGTANIIYTVNGGCGNTVSASKPYTVNANASAGTVTAGITPQCIGATTTYTVSGQVLGGGTGSWASDNGAVATVNGSTGVVTAVSAGTANIIYMVTGGCGTSAPITASKPYTVIANSAITSVTGPNSICIGGTATAYTANGVVLGSGTGAWSSSTPTVATVDASGNVTGVSVGTTNITYTISSGCNGNVFAQKSITVNPVPTVAAITGGATSVCVGGTTPAFANATPSGVWSIINGTGSATINASGVVTGVTAGNVDVVYTVTNGSSCSKSSTTPLTINPNYPAPIVGTPSRPSCAANGASVSISGLPASGNLLQDDGTTVTTIPFTSSSITVSQLAPGTYKFGVNNGCTVTYSAAVNVVANTFTGGTSWSYGTPPTSDEYVNFASGTTISTDATYCSVTVSNGAVVTVASGITLTVTKGVHVVGTGSNLIFDDTSTLIQNNSSNTLNTGTIRYNRYAGKIRQADYVYWSSPVKNQVLGALSSATASDKYFAFDGTKWVFTPKTSLMTVGKGYIIRGPDTYSNTSKTDFTGTFVGTPNNGDFTGEAMVGGNFYLLGNPYPSALSADLFILETTNKTLLDGTLYFWTHNTPVVLVGAYQYQTDDYAVYNLSGGAGTAAAPSGTKPGLDTPNKTIPNGKIGAGQAFFVGTIASGNVKFTNSMRLSGDNNNQFFKPGKTAKTAAIEKHRVWLNMTNDGGAFKQLLVAYVDGATNNYDRLFDGKTFDGNKFLDFYSINDNENLAIQGRGLPFNDADQVPLGYRTTIAGDFTIAIDGVDGNMTTQAIYVEDKKTGTIHDLRESNYTFTTEIGTFEDRLVLRYTNKSLGTGDFENVDKGITVSVKDKAVKILSSNEVIKEITIFDVAGKQLYDKKKVGTTELLISNLQSGNQVLLVDITLENGYKTTRKIIFQ
ncbi:Ig-like domain-containing protein [Flavobacterium daemonense]|uniref:Ig-like domain-containing protein n=1 Tax=Flavobacterium daemonense TaxID=1393049 RepID=UPI0013A6325C|nr:Ig-like domain-containing protein [Flavobacterium daemonense]KAF2335534.1 T9SS sorting signal type C domain-containing protein [Flavobacterium daemonense]